MVLRGSPWPLTLYVCTPSQVTAPVQWETIMGNLASAGYDAGYIQMRACI